MQPQSKPNFTAWFVMQGTIAAMRHPDFQDTANDKTLALYKVLSDASSKTRLISRLINSLPYSWQYTIGGLVTDSGRLRHFCFRKREIEKQTRQLLSEKSIKQVIILGAGLDVLSLRLATEFPAVKFIEIDTQESQAFKTASFKAAHINIPANAEFIAGDLRNPLASILANSKLFDSTHETLWIAEGFFMFIPEDSVIRIFKEARELSGIGSHIIFTSLPSYKTTSFLCYALQTFYLMEKSPYQWVIPFCEVPSFVGNLGYQCMFQMDYNTLQKSNMRQKFDINHHIEEDIHIAQTC